jgi:hypothetical protein
MYHSLWHIKPYILTTERVFRIVSCVISLRNGTSSLPTECICVFLMVLTINSDCFLKQVNVEVTLLLTVRKYILVSSTLVGLATRYYFLSECCCLKFSVLFLWGALFDERTGLQFAVQSHNGTSRAESVTILYYLIWDSLNMEGQAPVFISPRNRVAQTFTFFCINLPDDVFSLGQSHPVLFGS